jgi:hypothetical protein
MRFKTWKPIAAKRPMLLTPAFMRPHTTQAPALANFQLGRANAAPIAEGQIGRAKLVA